MYTYSYAPNGLSVGLVDRIDTFGVRPKTEDVVWRDWDHDWKISNQKSSVFPAISTNSTFPNAWLPEKHTYHVINY